MFLKHKTWSFPSYSFYLSSLSSQASVGFAPILPATWDAPPPRVPASASIRRITSLQIQPKQLLCCEASRVPLSYPVLCTSLSTLRRLSSPFTIICLLYIFQMVCVFLEGQAKQFSTLCPDSLERYPEHYKYSVNSYYKWREKERMSMCEYSWSSYVISLKCPPGGHRGNVVHPGMVGLVLRDFNWWWGCPTPLLVGTKS